MSVLSSSALLAYKYSETEIREMFMASDMSKNRIREFFDFYRTPMEFEGVRYWYKTVVDGWLSKPKKFNRGHFPVGTKVLVNCHSKEYVTVIDVHNVGPDSWCITTDKYNPYMHNYHSYNLCYVQEIIERGAGGYKVRDYSHWTGDYFSTVMGKKPDNRNKNNYYFHSIANFIEMLFAQHPKYTYLKEDHLPDVKRIIEELYKTRIVTVVLIDHGYPNGEVAYGYTVSKRKLHRRLKQLTAKYKLNRKREQQLEDDRQRAMFDDGPWT